MKREIKKLWVDALRSGEYEQGKERLRSGDQFCCLGVLSAIAVKSGVIASYDGRDGCLNEAVQEWAGLSKRDPDFKPRDADVAIQPQYADKVYLSGLNDNGKSFTEIADYIERYF